MERTRGEERLRWEWKLMFKKIAPDLAKFVGQQIRNLLKTTLDLELRDWTQLGVLHTEPVSQELWGGKLDYPKSISKVRYHWNNLMSTFHVNTDLLSEIFIHMDS